MANMLSFFLYFSSLLPNSAKFDSVVGMRTDIDNNPSDFVVLSISFMVSFGHPFRIL